MFSTNGPYSTVYAAPGTAATAIISNNTIVLREPDGTIETFIPNPDPSVQNYVFSSLTDTNGNEIYAVYDGVQLSSLQDKTGASIAFTYNAEGRITQAQASTGQVTTYNYDSTGEHVLSVASPDGTVVYTYAPSSSGALTENALASITDTAGVETQFGYDSQGRLGHQQGLNGVAGVTYAYPNIGEYTMTVDATNATTVVFYNEAGQTTALIDPLGNLYQYLYDSNGNLISTFLPEGSEVSYGYDGLGNETNEVDPLGGLVTMTYSQQTSNPAFSTLASVTVDNSTTQGGFLQTIPETTTYTTDQDGNLKGITDAYGNTTQFCPNPNGEVQNLISANGQATSYVYNSFGEVTKENFGNGVTTTFTYDNRGNLLTATNASGTTTFAYKDAQYPGLVTSVTDVYGRVITYCYDGMGRLTQMNENGYVVNYSYDVNGRLTTLTDGANNPIIQYTYNDANQLTQEDMGNGTRTVYTYDANGRVLSITNYASDLSKINSFDIYTYDQLGNILTDTSQDGQWAYTYDADSQLVGAAFTDPHGVTQQNIQYVYDSTGNRISQNVNGFKTSYATNALNQYTAAGGVAYSYDKDGNLTATSDGTTYTYNSQNQLVEVQSATGDTWTYTYDVLGNLIASNQNGQITQYLVDPSGIGNVVGQYDGSGNLLANYTQGLRLVNQITSTGANYYNFNITGSTIGVTGANGTYANSYSYLPFGELQSSAGILQNPFQFDGEFGVFAQANGLYYMQARFYNPSVGRFLNRDPLGVASGQNLYAFSGNDPVNRVDPTGLASNAAIALNTIGVITATASLVALAPVAAAGSLGILGGVAFGYAVFGLVTSGLNLAFASEGVKDSDLISTSPLGFVAGQIFGANSQITGIAEGADAIISTFIGVGAPNPKNFSKFGILANQILNILSSAASIDGAVKDYATTNFVSPADPNIISGPSGYGTAGFVPLDGLMPYTIGFENEPTADAPAKVVTITEQLDPNLDWSTFQLTDFSFGGIYYSVPASLTSYSAVIDATSRVGVDVGVSELQRTDRRPDLDVHVARSDHARSTGRRATGRLPPARHRSTPG